MSAFLAKLKADVAAVKAYLVEHYKQLLLALAAGHLGAVKAIIAGGAAAAHLLGKL